MKNSRLLGISGFLFSLALAGNVYAVGEYIYTPIMGMVQPNDINEAGQVVGNSAAFNSKPAIWEDGTLTILTNPPEAIYSSTAYSINEAGQVAGYIGTAAGRKYFLWDSNSPIIYIDLAKPISEAHINDSGVIALMADDTGQRLPYLYDNGVLALADNSGQIRSITGMNNHGVIVGYSSLNEAYSLINGVITFLGKLSDVGSSVAFDISNNSYNIVGASNVDNGNLQAVLWDSQSITSIGGDHTIARGVNDRKQIVLEICELPGESGCEAGLWEDNQLYNLNDLVITEGAPTLVNASAINNSGQIVGRDINLQAYLLTPIHAPQPLSIFPWEIFMPAILHGGNSKSPTP